MGVRDEEIKRLINYAKGLHTHVKIVAVKGKRECSALWESGSDGASITIFVKPYDSKLSIVLSLIHELGHMLDYIHKDNRKVPDTYYKASLDDSKKANREVVYNSELRGTEWWETIYKETNCKFPMNKLHVERDFDMWQYKVFFQTGNYPGVVEKHMKLKELRCKYE